MASTKNGVVLNINYPGKDIKIWVFRPDDHVLFIDEVKKFANISNIEPANENTLNQVSCAVGWLFPQTLIESCKKIKWIQSTSSGLDHLANFQKNHPEVLISSMKGLNADIVAEYVLSHILAIRWRILQYQHQAQEKIWHGYKTNDISDNIVLIIGLGNIGKKIAQNIKTMGMQVTAISRKNTPVDYVDKIYSYEDINQALAKADYVVLSLPLKPETRDIIGKAELSVMKPDSHLINISRGGVVNEQDLANALNNSTIQGAVLDVTETEPYPTDGFLWGVKNLLITPHVAGEHKEFAKKAARYWAQNLKLFLTNSLGPGNESFGKNK